MAQFGFFRLEDRLGSRVGRAVDLAQGRTQIPRQTIVNIVEGRHARLHAWTVFLAMRNRVTKHAFLQLRADIIVLAYHSGIKVNSSAFRW